MKPVLDLMRRSFPAKQPPEKLEVPSGLPDDFSPTAPEGLTQEEAVRRAAAGLSNAFKDESSKSPMQILCSNLFTFFNLLNILLALALASVGAWRNMLFLGVVISNTVIGTYQELKARRTIERLQLMNKAPVHVLRGGHDVQLDSDSLVQGDLVVLHPGDQVTADAIVVRGGGTANEALLTGEADAIEKKHGDWLLSGSYIASGYMTAQLVHVGQHSYVNRLTRAAKAVKTPHSVLMSDLNRLIRYLTFVLVPLGIMLFCRQYFLRHLSLDQAVPNVVAAMLGMIPEGLMLLTSMALFVGVIRLGKKDTLVSELYGIETLARVDTLCLDKTGTLTTGEMHTEALVPLREGLDEQGLQAHFSRFLGAFPCDSATLRALAASCSPQDETAEMIVPFNSAIKRSAAVFRDGTAYVMGAPSYVMGDSYGGEVQQQAAAAARQGWRVVLLASFDPADEMDENHLPMHPSPLGLALIGDTVRPSAPATLGYFRAQGVDVKVISGDDPETVSVVAQRAGLENAENAVDVSRLGDEELADAAVRYTVFGRVSPARKQLLVEALKAAGHSVAMTGDGINDIPALKAADCSIAMATGSDAAKHSAQITLMSADFEGLPAVVAEGRRVVNNITNAASLFLVKTLYSFALSLLLLFLPAAYPFQPIQLTLISSLTIGFPSFVLALQPNTRRIEGNFLRTIVKNAIPGAAAVTVCACTAMMLEQAGWSHADCATISTVTAALMHLVTLILLCRPFNLLRAALVSVMTVSLALCFWLLPQVFYLAPLTGQAALICGLLGILGMLLILVLRWLIREHKLILPRLR